MEGLIWVKYWFTDLTSKKLLADMSFDGVRLFGASLDELIKNVTSGKSTFLSLSRRVNDVRRKPGLSVSANAHPFRRKDSYSRDKASRPSSATSGRGNHIAQ